MEIADVLEACAAFREISLPHGIYKSKRLDASKVEQSILVTTSSQPIRTFW